MEFPIVVLEEFTIMYTLLLRDVFSEDVGSRCNDKCLG